MKLERISCTTAFGHEARAALTCFAFLCDAAEYKVAPKFGKSKWRGWYVRYRVAYSDHINVRQLLCEVDTSYTTKSLGS